MSPTDPTAAQRVARWNDKLRRLGYVRKSLWVPAERAAELARIAEEMCEQKEAADGRA
jgi:hypothetical protein